MMRAKKIPGCFTVVLLFSLRLAGQEVPEGPDKLVFPELKFEVPKAEEFRTELNNGVSVYIAEDRQLPLVSLQLIFRGGRYLEPDGKEGLAQLTGRVWRTGGAGELDARGLDEELAFLAASLNTSIGGTTGTVSLDLLAKDVDRGLKLFMDVLLNPRFEQERLDSAKDELMAQMRRRNDSTASLEGQAWQRLIYGEDYWLNRLATKASVESITRGELLAFHSKLLDADHMVVVAAGDFQRGEMLDRLNSTIGELKPIDTDLPPVPQPAQSARPGVYLIDKPDVNQGRVSIGHSGVRRPVDQEFDIRIANDVLGGGGFTSWITSRVRSDEGLAYSAGSSFSIGTEYPGTFRAAFQSKSETVSRAAQLTIELIRRLRVEGISSEELDTSQASFIQTFPNRFQSKLQTIATFASDELIGRSSEYWQQYRSRIAAVTTESARRSAQDLIRPDDLIILIVGNLEEIAKGHPDHPDATLESLGPVTRLPLLDPMTLTPLR